MMAVIYLLSAGAVFVLHYVGHIDGGFCVLLVSDLTYTLCFAPILLRTIIIDSKECREILNDMFYLCASLGSQDVGRLCQLWIRMVDESKRKGKMVFLETTRLVLLPFHQVSSISSSTKASRSSIPHMLASHILSSLLYPSTRYS